MHSQRPSQALAALQVASTTFTMNAMVGGHLPQLKMPPLDAYARDTSRWAFAAFRDPTSSTAIRQAQEKRRLPGILSCAGGIAQMAWQARPS